MTDWISVKDRLPEIGQFVLGYEGGAILVFIFRNKYGRPDFWAGHETVEWPDADLLAEVTHWMPLPEPPK